MTDGPPVAADPPVPDGPPVPGSPPVPDGPLIEVAGLRVAFPARSGRIEAVRGVDFTLSAGECLAIVGESGSGKSVTVRSLLGLAGPGARVSADRMALDGESLTGLSPRRLRDIRGGRIGLVLQDALVSLDPLRTVEAEIGEALRNHRVVDKAGVPRRVVELLRDAQVPEPELRARQRSFQLSGGLRQRALIASALAAEPAVLVADEPTTALDVTTQARLLELLAAKKAAGTALLLVSHDLAVVAGLADRIAVMYRGRFVEEGPAGNVLRRPTHPYTRALLAAVPVTHAKGTRLSVPAPSGAHRDLPVTGCSYAPRCPLATDQCRTDPPPVVATGAEQHARCWRTTAPWQPPPRVPGGTPRSRPAEGAPSVPVLRAEGLRKSFRGPDGVHRPAVADVSFTLEAGETLGIVGESGSGKTTVANLVLALLAPDAGTVRVRDEPWSELPESARRLQRRRIQLVQQDPFGSFDPRYSVERIVGEALPGGRAARRKAAGDLLDLVGLDPRLLARRPAQLSGGERQRVAIARALACEPDILVCDEPVSALDVSVQAQILDLFDDLRSRLDTAMLFISHDLGVVRHTSDRVLVMRGGEAVETGPVEDVFRRPQHPYTRELLAALPRPDVPPGTEDSVSAVTTPTSGSAT